MNINVSSIFSLTERMMPISLHQLSNQCMRVNRPFWGVGSLGGRINRVFQFSFAISDLRFHLKLYLAGVQ